MRTSTVTVAADPEAIEYWQLRIQSEMASPSLAMSAVFETGPIEPLKWWEVPMIRIRRQIMTRLKLIWIALGRIDRAESHLYPVEL